jgi:hypothetical protein
MTETELVRSTAVLTAVERLLGRMRKAGEPDPVATLRATLALNDLTGAVQVPLLFPLEDVRALMWAPEVRQLLQTFDFSDAILARRLVARALDVITPFS